MAKPAEVIVEDQVKDSLLDGSIDEGVDQGVDGDKLFLRQLKEEQIRTRLDEFARELAEMGAKREKR